MPFVKQSQAHLYNSTEKRCRGYLILSQRPPRNYPFPVVPARWAFPDGALLPAVLALSSCPSCSCHSGFPISDPTAVLAYVRDGSVRGSEAARVRGAQAESPVGVCGSRLGITVYRMEGIALIVDCRVRTQRPSSIWVASESVCELPAGNCLLTFDKRCGRHHIAPPIAKEGTGSMILRRWLKPAL